MEKRLSGVGEWRRWEEGSKDGGREIVFCGTYSNNFCVYIYKQARLIRIGAKDGSGEAEML